MSEIKQAASQTVAEIASNPKVGLGIGGASAYLSTITTSDILTVMSLILVTISIVNQANTWRDRRKAAKDDRSND